METRAPFLTTPYGGYSHRRVPREDEDLTHVGPDTPCGEYFRRFWQPIVFLRELNDLPVSVRVLGEDLVVFRDRSGRVGLMELHCCHRGTSLEFGIVSERGIRCCYHGWLYDIDGKILETPGEPADSTLKDRLYHGAYPTHEHNGLVFAYMGPPEAKPPFPIYDTYEMPGYRTWSGLRHLLPCNWLQVKENSMDPAHLSFLHTIDGYVGFGKELKLHSELDYMETPIGMVYIDTRRVGDKVWVRMADYVAPNMHQFGAGSQDFSVEVRFQRSMMTHWAVPIDDDHTMNFRLRHVREGQDHEPEVMSFGQSEDRPYGERQRVPGDYDVQVGQRPIAVHALEHLATTDRGVILLRNMVSQGIRAVQSGQSPNGLVTEGNEYLPTYANDTIIRVPEAPTEEEERKLLRETGREVAGDYINNPPTLRSQVP